jgi:hypothetical protein
MATETKTEIVITPGMTAAGLKVLRQSGAIEHSTGAIEVLVADIYKAMALAGYGNVAVEVTVPGVLEPGAEMTIKNESDHPIRVIADPHERLKLKTRGQR